MKENTKKRRRRKNESVIEKKSNSTAADAGNDYYTDSYSRSQCQDKEECTGP